MGELRQLSPTIPLDTEKGLADAYFIQDDGRDAVTLFGVFVRATGEFWWVSQTKVRLERNWSTGVRQEEDCGKCASRLPLREDATRL